MKTPFLKIFVLIVILLAGVLVYMYYPFGKSSEDLHRRAQEFCAYENVARVEILPSESLIKVTSSLLGGGDTYYSAEGVNLLHCPIVGPDSITPECVEMQTASDWEPVCENDEAFE